MTSSATGWSSSRRDTSRSPRVTEGQHPTAGLSTQGARWRPVIPDEALRWFAQVSVPWWIAGGWAIDLYLGRTTRDHGDLDVGVLRRDVPVLLRGLEAWEVYEADDGRLARLSPGALPGAAVNSLWCRRAHESDFILELLLDDSEREYWVYRRDARVRRKLTQLFSGHPSGLRYLAPEVQLLYKSRNARAKDHEDFRAAVAQLDASARAWLRRHLPDTRADWIAQLA